MKELKEHIFERCNEDYNVLSENEERCIITFDASDICVLVDKLEKKLYFLIPLTRKHTFCYNPDSLYIDGKLIKSDIYWVEFENQVVEYQGDVPNTLKKNVINEILADFV